LEFVGNNINLYSFKQIAILVALIRKQKQPCHLPHFNSDKTDTIQSDSQCKCFMYNNKK